MSIFDGLNAVGTSLINMNLNSTASAMEANIVQSLLYQQLHIYKFIVIQLKYFNGKFACLKESIR